MECKCKKDHVIGRIIREFLVRPTPLCAAVGPMIREIGRLELSCYCGCCRSEKLCFDIEFPQLPERDDARAQTRRIALVREPFCCKALVDIRMHLDGPNLINFDYEGEYDRQYGRVWECKLRNGHVCIRIMTPGPVWQWRHGKGLRTLWTSTAWWKCHEMHSLVERGD